jgi:diguanylate cyclase (GGDEF)-like protein
MDDTDTTLNERALRAHHQLFDDLTGLPSRGLFLDRLEQVTLGATRGGTAFALILIDLDYPDEFGDEAQPVPTDQLLREVARRLVRTARKSDTIARLSHRQFAGILLGTSSADGARIAAEKITSAMQQPFVIDGHSILVNPSIGIAVYPDNGIDGGSLLRCASPAMQHAGRASDGIELFEEDFPPTGHEAAPAVLRFKDALENHELLVHYQPKIDLATREVSGVEALARWRSPEHGLLMPAQFIPDAERSAAISPMTFAILELALDQANRWAADGMDLPVAVNVSARMLCEEGFAARVIAAVERRGLSPHLLTLDVTEAALVSSFCKARAALHDLTKAGICIALDDFGTGHASLHELRDLDISELKIDRLFITHITRTGKDASILRSIAALANGLDVRVIAKGIEERETWGTLLELGCRFGQGFDIGRPMDAPALDNWLAGWNVMAAAARSTSPEMHYA